MVYIVATSICDMCCFFFWVVYDGLIHLATAIIYSRIIGSLGYGLSIDTYVQLCVRLMDRSLGYIID